MHFRNFSLLMVCSLLSFVWSLLDSASISIFMTSHPAYPRQFSRIQRKVWPLYVPNWSSCCLSTSTSLLVTSCCWRILLKAMALTCSYVFGFPQYPLALFSLAIETVAGVSDKLCLLWHICGSLGSSCYKKKKSKFNLKLIWSLIKKKKYFKSIIIITLKCRCICWILK